MELDDTERPPDRAPPLFAADTAPSAAVSRTGPRPLRSLILDAGAATLSDEDLIALLLAGVDTPANGRRIAGLLISRFRTASRILAATPDGLQRIPGVTRPHAALIKAAEALATRHARASVPERIDPLLSSYDSVVKYCRTLAAHRPVEELHLLHLDGRNRLIADELHQRGTVNHTPAYPREICVRALDLGSTAIIIIHNHPSGVPQPSRSDIKLTNSLRDALTLIDVTLHDHIVVTASDAFSFRHKGLL